MDFVSVAYDLGQQLPGYEQFALRSQLQKASVSIPSNIAEGSSRSSKKDFARFVEISLGSAFECETLLLVIQRQHVRRRPSLKTMVNTALTQIEEIKKMVYSFRERLVA